MQNDKHQLSNKERKIGTFSKNYEIRHIKSIKRNFSFLKSVKKTSLMREYYFAICKTYQRFTYLCIEKAISQADIACTFGPSKSNLNSTWRFIAARDP